MTRTNDRSMLDRWDSLYKGLEEPFAYGNTPMYERAIAFLDGQGILEDWGCGTAYARRFVKEATYRGVDGTRSTFCDIYADLREYRSDAEFILMRGVLEHNYEWERILDNVLASARKRLAIVVFTPFSEQTRELAWVDWAQVPDLSFRKEDLTSRFPPNYTEETLATETKYGVETAFYITMPQP